MSLLSGCGDSFTHALPRKNQQHLQTKLHKTFTIFLLPRPHLWIVFWKLKCQHFKLLLIQKLNQAGRQRGSHITISSSGACLGWLGLLRKAPVCWKLCFELLHFKSSILSLPVGRYGLAELQLGYFRTLSKPTSPCLMSKRWASGWKCLLRRVIF